jgi:site-specific DNA recombinase
VPRLTLNVLLSFAQFEREVTSERIRDKIAASKRKGLWVGGPLPLGYQMKDGKIAIVENEAERVRLIFQRYLDLGGVNALVRDLRERNIRSKTRLLATGATRGGVLFGRGSLFYLLRNRFYVGEVKYKDEILPGEQPAIMDRALFDAVQQKLTQQWTTRSTTRNASDHLLTGLLFDDAGHRMVPTHATKASVRYRYYVSLPHLHGESKTASVGSVSRVPATDIEDTIVNSLSESLVVQKEKPSSIITRPDRKVILEQVARIDVHEDRLAIRLKPAGDQGTADAADDLLSIPWPKPPSRKSRQILIPHDMPKSEVRPTRIERRARLVNAIARGRRWLDEIVSGSVTDVQQSRTSKMQRAPGQHDHLARLSRTRSRAGRGRRPAAARYRSRTIARCASRMEPAVRGARIEPAIITPRLDTTFFASQGSQYFRPPNGIGHRNPAAGNGIFGCRDGRLKSA